MKDLPSNGNGVLLTNTENYKIAQALYHVITGKTEKTTKPYTSNYYIKFEDIEQLHNKLTQMLSQWNVLGSSCNLIVSHCDDGNDEFSSFERFRLYDFSKATSIEYITFSFSFLLRQQNQEDDGKDFLQNYNITVRMLNQVSFYNNRKTHFRSQIIRMITDENLILEIEYVDYAIARNIISTIDSWEAELEKNDGNKVIDKMQNVATYFPPIFRLIFFVVTGSVLIKNINPNIVDMFSSVKFGLISCLCLYGFSQIGYYLGRFIENNIDGLSSLAFIDINRGDKKEIKKYKRNFIRRVYGVLTLVVISTVITFLNESIIGFIKDLFK